MGHPALGKHSLNAEGNFRDKPFHFTGAPRRDSLSKLMHKAYVRVQTRHPSLLTQHSDTSNSSFSEFIGRGPPNTAPPKRFLFTIYILDRVYLEHVVQFITK